MGRPKALLRHTSGGTYVEHAVAVARPWAEAVVLLGTGFELPGSLGGVPRLRDRRADLGPMSGLCSLLEFAGEGWTVMVACDLPLLTGAVMEKLLGRVDDRCDAVVLVTAGDGRWHPCCAAYHGRLLAEVRSRIESGETSLRALLREVRTKTVRLDSWMAGLVTNVNTPGDHARVGADAPERPMFRVCRGAASHE